MCRWQSAQICERISNNLARPKGRNQKIRHGFTPINTVLKVNTGGVNHALQMDSCLRRNDILMADLTIENIEGGVVFLAKIVPGSSRTCVCGLLGEMVKIKVAAPPEKGKANQGLIEFLAKELGVKKNAISIISGQTNPIKQVQVLGISADALLKKLNLTRRPDSRRETRGQDKEND
jgi:uncharacterized protein